MRKATYCISTIIETSKTFPVADRTSFCASNFILKIVIKINRFLSANLRRQADVVRVKHSEN